MVLPEYTELDYKVALAVIQKLQKEVPMKNGNFSIMIETFERNPTDESIKALQLSELKLFDPEYFSLLTAEVFFKNQALPMYTFKMGLNKCLIFNMPEGVKVETAQGNWKKSLIMLITAINISLIPVKENVISSNS